MKLITRERGSLKDYEEAKRWHEDACRSWKILTQCWYWLCDQGRFDQRPDAVQARANAEKDRVLAGWDLSTLMEARRWNVENPIGKFPYKKPKKSVASSEKSNSFDDGYAPSDTRTDLMVWIPTPIVGRDRVQQFGDRRRHMEIMAELQDASERAGDAPAASFYRQRLQDLTEGQDAVAAIVEPLVESIDIPNPDDQQW